jgi:hypothetical protein
MEFAMSDECCALLEKVKRILMCSVVAWAEVSEVTDLGAPTRVGGDGRAR